MVTVTEEILNGKPRFCEVIRNTHTSSNLSKITGVDYKGPNLLGYLERDFEYKEKTFQIKQNKFKLTNSPRLMGRSPRLVHLLLSPVSVYNVPIFGKFNSI